MSAGDPLPLPYAGPKQVVNAPLDFGPYEGISVRSWPGHKAVPHPDQLMTIFFSTLNGEKVPILVRPCDTIASLRQRIWQKMHGSIKLQELDDDIDNRFSQAIWGAGRPTRCRDVADISVDTPLAGNVHYSRQELVEPDSYPTSQALRKKAPFPPGYKPPLRTAQNGGELELYLGLIKVEDGLPPPLSESVNTGAPPKYIPATLTEAGVTDGCVLRVEYTRLSSEVRDRRQDRGDMNDVGTVASRVTETVLDPDWYVSSLESTPYALMDFFGISRTPESGGECTSNCQAVNKPHIGTGMRDCECCVGQPECCCTDVSSSSNYMAQPQVDMAITSLKLVPIPDKPSASARYTSTYNQQPRFHGFGTAVRSSVQVLPAPAPTLIPVPRPVSRSRSPPAFRDSSSTQYQGQPVPISSAHSRMV